MRKALLILAFTILVSSVLPETMIPKALADDENVVDSSSIFGKVVAGYQAWFRVPRKSIDDPGFVHWGSSPRPGSQTFDVWPDTREYSENALAQVPYSPLGNGEPAELFGSLEEGVVDTHFRWMKESGMDGVAVQRFLSADRARQTKVFQQVREAAEKHGRIYYAMYDISGGRDNYDQVVLEDIQAMLIDSLDTFSSDRYLKQDGKPVICIWGVGVSGRPTNLDAHRNLIATLKQKGFYVILGTPANFRDLTDYLPIYNSADMLSPWAVGRGNPDQYFNDIVLGDIDYCNANNVAYLPVVFSGFSWFSLHPESTPNLMPRAQGSFLWKMGYNAISAGCQSLYVAMFDEYDEGTNIAKMAEDSFMAPIDNFFVTASIDGKYVSSDLYLRIAGYFSDVLKQKQTLKKTVSIPLTLGPVFFRTSFEYMDAAVNQDELISGASLDYHRIFNKGATSLKMEFPEESSRRIREFNAFDVNFTATKGMGLSYAIFPSDENGRKIKVDVVTEDGMTLTDVDAEYPLDDLQIGQWNFVKIMFPEQLRGKKIVSVTISAPNNDKCKAYIDTIIIATDEAELELAKPTEGVKYYLAARTLNLLGYIKSTTPGEYVIPLTEKLTRIEFLRTALDVLGLKTTADAVLRDTTFDDVSFEHGIYVGYAQLIGMVNGVSEGRFGVELNITGRQALTILLKGMGYSDDNIYENALSKALEVGILSDVSQFAIMDQELSQDQLIALLYNTLFAKGADGRRTIDKLTEKDILSDATIGYVWEPYFKNLLGN